MVDKTTYPPDDRKSIPLYFGCWSSVGHGFHRSDGSNANYGPLPIPKPKAGERFKTAGPPTPWGFGVEDLAPKGTTQGKAKLHHKDGWTALAVDDFTIDSRGNSKSVFCFPLHLEFEEILKESEKHFPKIIKRIGKIILI